MLLKVSKSSDVKESQVTDESLYRERRRFLQASASLTTVSLAPSLSMWPTIGSASINFSKIEKSDFSTDEETQITTNRTGWERRMFPDIYENKVVWVNKPGGEWGEGTIYMTTIS